MPLFKLTRLLLLPWKKISFSIYAQDLGGQFLQALRAKYKVEIHTDVIKTLTEE